MSFLIDTNVLSAMGKGPRADPNVVRWAASVPAESQSVSVPTIAEIRCGIEAKLRRDPVQADLLDGWLSRLRTGLAGRIVPVDEAIAEEWARLSVPDPCPFVDGLLAATAKVRGLVLVTGNATDVARSGVTILNPFEAKPA